MTSAGMYLPIPGLGPLKSVLDAKLAEYNEGNAMMDLVLFDEASTRAVVVVVIAMGCVEEGTYVCIYICVCMYTLNVPSIRTSKTHSSTLPTHTGHGTRHPHLPHPGQPGRQRPPRRGGRLGEAVPDAAGRLHLWVPGA